MKEKVPKYFADFLYSKYVRYTGWFQIIVGVTVAYNFQIKNNKIKLLMKYESVTQKGLVLTESILHNAKQLQHAHFSWHVRYVNYRPRRPRQ
jgi:hypothetical protein